MSAPDRPDRPYSPPQAQLGGSGGARYVQEGSVFVSQATPVTAGGRAPASVHTGDSFYAVSASGSRGRFQAPRTRPRGVGRQHHGTVNVSMLPSPQHPLAGHSRHGTVNVSAAPRDQVSVQPSPFNIAPPGGPWTGAGVPPWKHYGDGDVFVGPPTFAVSGRPFLSSINVADNDVYVLLFSVALMAGVAGFAAAGGFKRGAKH